MKRREFYSTLLVLIIMFQNAISQSGISDDRNKFKPVILVKANHESNPGDRIERNILTVLQGYDSIKKILNTPSQTVVWKGDKRTRIELLYITGW